jgi:hypothetical protein
LTITVTLNTGLTVSNPQPKGGIAGQSSIDVHQMMTILSNASGGSGPYTFHWGIQAGLAYLVNCQQVDTNATSAYSCLVTGVSGAPVNAVISVEVEDSNGCWYPDPCGGGGGGLAVNVTLYPDPTVSSPVASMPSGGIDAGQNVTFTSSTPSGGLGPYTYNWTSLPPGCPQSNLSYVVCTPAVGGDYLVTVEVTDSDGYNVSGSAIYLVDSDPQMTGPLASRTNVDVGQVIVFSVLAGGGSGTYIYSWLESSPDIGCMLTANESITCLVEAAGTFTVSAQVRDSNGYTLSRESSQPVMVFIDPTAGTPVPSHLMLDVGQVVTFTVEETGGYGTLNYTWSESGKGLACTFVSTPTISCIATVAGTGYNVTVQVSDASGVESPQSTSPAVTVFAAPEVFVLHSVSLVGDEGQWFNLTARPNGGFGEYGFTWYVDGTAVSGASKSTYVFYPKSAGTFVISVSATDSLGGVANSYPESVTVGAPPNLGIAATTSSIGVGESDIITALVSGGVGPMYFTWFMNGSTDPVWWGSTCDFVPVGAGTYLFEAKVVDAEGKSAQSTVISVNVVARTSGAHSEQSAPVIPTNVQIITCLCGVAAVCILLAVSRRKGGGRAYRPHWPNTTDLTDFLMVWRELILRHHFYRSKG